MNNEEQRKFKRKIAKRPDIQEYMRKYRWVKDRLKVFLCNKGQTSSCSDEYLDKLANKDIDKYLWNYKPSDTDTERENQFIEILNHCSGKTKKTFGDKYGFIMNLAASIAFIAVIIAAGIHFSRMKDNQHYGDALFTQYFQPYEDQVLTELNSSYNNFAPVKPGINSDNHIFHNEELKTILRNSDMKKEDILMISVSLIENEEYSLAHLYLHDLLEDADTKITNAARWYLALLDIRKGKYKKAGQNLNLLCNSNNFYTRESCYLLENLKKKTID